MNFAKLTVLTGHYGTGKTNFAINCALELKRQGKKVILVDLDLVNPYFRSADFEELCKSTGIALAAPAYANSNLDLPALSGSIDRALADTEAYVIVDAGGDDVGAIALGRFSQTIKDRQYQMLYVINQCRYLQNEDAAQETVVVLREIEAVSRLTATGLVNNSHMQWQTTPQLVEQSAAYANEVAAKTGLPVVCTAVEQSIAPKVSLQGIFPVAIIVKTPWEQAFSPDLEG